MANYKQENRVTNILMCAYIQAPITGDREIKQSRECGESNTVSGIPEPAGTHRGRGEECDEKHHGHGYEKGFHAPDNIRRSGRRGHNIQTVKINSRSGSLAAPRTRE